MLKNLLKSLTGKSSNELSKDEIVELLKIQPELLEKFENAYKSILDEPEEENFFKVSAKQASADNKKGKIEYTGENLDSLISQIVDELLVEAGLSKKEVQYLEAAELNQLPLEVRPQLSGKLVQKDIGAPSYQPILMYYREWKKTGNQMMYNQFRQGLDILDLDPVIYEMLGMNQNSMGNWFPTLKNAVDKSGFFKYPKTKIVKVPLPILQLTRLDYSAHTPTTLKIVNDFCMKAFDLDVNKKYFIKTGTYSSKFDFRNALVQGEKEVRELGEYLLFIHFQALQMASPLSQPIIYGVSTTNEWVVREFVEDVEENPTIYKGMPLRTEYRFFVDFDTKEVLGVSPYWREDVMIRSFQRNPQDPHNKHDYVIYKMHEERLYKKYNDNVDNLKEKVQVLIQEMDLSGQWSLDIMQNGEEFYVIDMAGAADSALSDCVPQHLLVRNPENWIPNFTKQIEGGN